TVSTGSPGSRINRQSPELAAGVSAASCGRGAAAGSARPWHAEIIATTAATNRTAAVLSRPRRLRALLRFHRALRLQDVGHPVVALVAGVLVDRLLDPRHRILARPRPIPRVRILDGELISNRVGIDEREPLRDPEM